MFRHVLQARSFRATISHNVEDIGRTSQSVILSLWRSFLDLSLPLSLYILYIGACTPTSVKTVRCDLAVQE